MYLSYEKYFEKVKKDILNELKVLKGRYMN